MAFGVVWKIYVFECFDFLYFIFSIPLFSLENVQKKNSEKRTNFKYSIRIFSFQGRLLKKRFSSEVVLKFLKMTLSCYKSFWKDLEKIVSYNIGLKLILHFFDYLIWILKWEMVCGGLFVIFLRGKNWPFKLIYFKGFSVLSLVSSVCLDFIFYFALAFISLMMNSAFNKLTSFHNDLFRFFLKILMKISWNLMYPLEWAH